MTDPMEAKLGSQRLSPRVRVLGGMSTLLAAVPAWLQFGPVVGAPLAVLGLIAVATPVRREHRPCFTIRDDALVWHIGSREKAYPWGILRGPVSIRRLHFQTFLQLRRKGRRLLLPLCGLNPDERERLREIVRGMVRLKAARARAEELPEVPAST